MGWGSGGSIFDPVASALIKLKAKPSLKRKVLGVLLEQLLAGDWDTEGESFHEFHDDLVIVSIFYEQNTCNEISYDFNGRIEATRKPRRWQLVCGKCGVLDERDMTKTDHDDLIRGWAVHEKDVHEGDGEVADWMLFDRTGVES